MTVRLSLYQKAEQELYRLDRSVKAKFYDFSHKFRTNPNEPGLRLKQLKGDARIYSARIDDSYRALLARAGKGPRGEESWLLLAVRHRKDVYDQLSVAVNRITGELEFVDLSIVGESALRRAGITLTPDEPDTETPPAPATSEPAEPAEVGVPVAATSLLTDYTAEQLRDFGVAEKLIDLALSVTSSSELDQLVEGAPLLSRDVLYGLAAGMSPEEVLREITAPVKSETAVDPEDFTAALGLITVTPLDEASDLALRNALDEGDFRAWKIFLHPTQRKIADRDYNGPARVSGGPGTGKTIVALHRVNHLARALPPGQDVPILLTTFTKNLAADLKGRLETLLPRDLLRRVEVTHVDQLAARVLGENTPPGRGTRRRIDDHQAREVLETIQAETADREFDPEFLLDEWEQVILGLSLASRNDYFQARRVGRGKLSRPQRDRIWKLLEQLTVRLDKAEQETWAQAAERAARYEMQRARRVAESKAGNARVGDKALAYQPDNSGWSYREYRYEHIVVDEAQDLRPSHWKMLRAMVGPGRNDMFIAGDTYQRIYDNQVSLSALGVNIVGRSTRLTLSYRTTKEILGTALGVMNAQTYDDLDDGAETLVGYRSVLTGPTPTFAEYGSWNEELAALGQTIAQWKQEQAEAGVAASVGRIAIAVAERDKVNNVMWALKRDHGIDCAELTKDGPRGDGDVHVGTMHRFKGLEYQKLAIVAVSDGILPRAGIQRFEESDPQRYKRELKKARSLLFVSETRARDALAISWHGRPSPFLNIEGGGAAITDGRG